MVCAAAAEASVPGCGPVWCSPRETTQPGGRDGPSMVLLCVVAGTCRAEATVTATAAQGEKSDPQRGGGPRSLGPPQRGIKS